MFFYWFFKTFNHSDAPIVSFCYTPNSTSTSTSSGVMIMINSTRQQPAQSFTLFPRLPVELQRLIWELGLPARIVELDLQGYDMVPVPTSFSYSRRRISTAALR